MTNFVTVCKTADVPDGEARMFSIGDRLVGVFHLDGQFFALRNECPHAGASLAHGAVEGDVVRCRIHHWGFCIRDGRYVDHDQPEYNAQTYSVRVVGDEVQIAE